MDQLRDGACVGETLQLACGNHPHTVACIGGAEDFDALSPDGGCTRPCAAPLACGHPCPRCALCVLNRFLSSTGLGFSRAPLRNGSCRHLLAKAAASAPPLHGLLLFTSDAPDSD